MRERRKGPQRNGKMLFVCITSDLLRCKHLYTLFKSKALVAVIKTINACIRYVISQMKGKRNGDKPPIYKSIYQPPPVQRSHSQNRKQVKTDGWSHVGGWCGEGGSMLERGVGRVEACW